MTEGETARAIDLFTQALANGESPVEVLLERAKARISLGRLPQAIDDLGRAVKLDPKKADAHYFLGVAKARGNDLAGAIEAYSAAIGAQPDYVKAYSNRAGILGRQGNA
jgi:tetratricopeptide (TPR) repeat protein